MIDQKGFITIRRAKGKRTIKKKKETGILALKTARVRRMQSARGSVRKLLYPQ